jgi:hypothetical protein
MKYRIVLAATVGFIAGLVVGIGLSKYDSSLDEFPGVMALRLAVMDGLTAVPPKMAIQLLDLYEAQVLHQSKWPRFNGFDWDQELTSLALQRYIVYSKTGQGDLAGKALDRAARLRNHRAPTAEDLDFERQLANRLFNHSPNEAGPEH